MVDTVDVFASLLQLHPWTLLRTAVLEPVDDAAAAVVERHPVLTTCVLADGRTDEAIRYVRDSEELGAALHLVARVAVVDRDRIGDALATIPPVPRTIAPLMRLAYEAGKTPTGLAIYQAILGLGVPAGGTPRTLYLRTLNNAVITAQHLGDLAEAVRIADQAQPYAAENPHIYHSAACVYALTGDLERAMTHVRLAVAARYEHLDLVATDTDLDAIRHWPAFRALFPQT